ncbi:hypothetical protein VTK73DRAFT_7698 [Phialemonium thermophilum]|uniref:Uncharacterized protein n=1 Tax=Phialemonium thermophilum TaxID=223376 RepID=A0ABR3XSQ1_9PEZI
MVCLSYRGYWTSLGRPSEKGIMLDAEAALQWIAKRHADSYKDTEPPRPAVLLWGQSIGCGVATNLAAAHPPERLPEINGLILETPFTSVRAMLETLYPQKWLPYRYLWPFLRNNLDSWTNLGVMADNYRRQGAVTPRIFILEAGRDEIVPPQHGDMLQQRCEAVGLSVQKRIVSGALHNESTARMEGRKAVADFILREMKDFIDSRHSSGP